MRRRSYSRVGYIGSDDDYVDKTSWDNLNWSPEELALLDSIMKQASASKAPKGKKGAPTVNRRWVPRSKAPCWVKSRDAAGRTIRNIIRAVRMKKCERAETIIKSQAFLKAMECAGTNTLVRVDRLISKCWENRFNSYQRRHPKSEYQTKRTWFK